MTDLFEIEDGRLKLNINILAIPEFKALYESNIDDYEPPFLYVHFMTHPNSGYHNLQESDKQTMISDAVGGTFDLEDEILETAIEKARELYATPIQEYYEGQKNSMFAVGRFLKSLSESSITTGRDGNLSEIVRMQKEAGRTMESFLKLEKLWQEQVKQKLRGNSELGEY